MDNVPDTVRLYANTTFSTCVKALGLRVDMIWRVCVCRYGRNIDDTLDAPTFVQWRSVSSYSRVAKRCPSLSQAERKLYGWDIDVELCKMNDLGRVIMYFVY